MRILERRHVQLLFYDKCGNHEHGVGEITNLSCSSYDIRDIRPAFLSSIICRLRTGRKPIPLSFPRQKPYNPGCVILAVN
jgi:hypothetical protein